MKLANDIGVWEPNELIYKASDLPSYTYLVIEGHAQIVTMQIRHGVIKVLLACKQGPLRGPCSSA